MSCYMVDKEHIDLLVALLLNLPRYAGNVGSETPDRLGGYLVAANLAGVQARYPDTIENPEDTPGPCAQYWQEPYQFTQQPYRLTAVEALAAIAGYRYQCIDSEEWSTTPACGLLEDLKDAIIRNLPGYDAAPWAWTAEEIEVRTTPEQRLRAQWTAEGVPQARQDARIAEITAKAQVGPFAIGGAPA